ncbi:hypothetical protein MRX96_055481 [Rhipicephalus microplus]
MDETCRGPSCALARLGLGYGPQLWLDDDVVSATAIRRRRVSGFSASVLSLFRKAVQRGRSRAAVPGFRCPRSAHAPSTDVVIPSRCSAQ